MDPNVLFDLLYLKLTLEFQQRHLVTRESFDKTKQVLKRLRPVESAVTKSQPSVATFISTSLMKPKNATEKELARLAIFDPLIFKDRNELLKKFDSKDENIVIEFMDKLVEKKKKPKVSFKQIRRYRSNLRSRVRYQ